MNRASNATDSTPLSHAATGPDDPADAMIATVEADAANFTMEIEGVPSENPKTGRLTPLSMIAALKRLTAPLVIGT